MLRIPAQHDQREESLQAQGIECAQALSVEHNLDSPEETDR